MPQIIVTAGAGREVEQSAVMLRERVNESDFESQRFVSNLLERLGWAVEDATEAERGGHTAELDVSPLPDLAEPEPDPEPASYAWDPDPVGVS